MDLGTADTPHSPTEKNANTIFKTPTRILHVKNNYKDAYKDVTCRACQQKETQGHVPATCPAIRNNATNKIENELFPENLEDLKQTSRATRYIRIYTRSSSNS